MEKFQGECIGFALFQDYTFSGTTFIYMQSLYQRQDEWKLN